MSQPEAEENAEVLLIQKKEAARDHVWGEYRACAATSRSQKGSLSRWRKTILWLGIIGATLGTLAQQLHGGSGSASGWSSAPAVLGVLSAVALGFAAFFGRELLSPDRERRWVRTRSAAEALKSQVYLFATETPPYDREKATDLLFAASKKITRSVHDIALETISENERKKHLPPLPLPVNEYVKIRVDDQVAFYGDRTQTLKQTTDRWKTTSLCLGALAVLLGALGFSGLTAGWVAVISTVTASIAAYAYASRYQYLIISYQATGGKLRQLQARWKASGEPAANATERNRLIVACEGTISVENSAWMAEWSRDEAVEATPPSSSPLGASSED